MGSYKWGYKPLKWVMTIVALLITPLTTTHEPPSKAWSSFMHYQKTSSWVLTMQPISRHPIIWVIGDLETVHHDTSKIRNQQYGSYY